MANYIGQAEAAKLGYLLHHYAGQGDKNATYLNEELGLWLHITCNTRGAIEAELSYTQLLLTLSTGKFQWPHGNFVTIFQNPMVCAKVGMEAGLAELTARRLALYQRDHPNG